MAILPVDLFWTKRINMELQRRSVQEKDGYSYTSLHHTRYHGKIQWSTSGALLGHARLFSITTCCSVRYFIVFLIMAIRQIQFILIIFMAWFCPLTSAKVKHKCICID